MHRRFARGVAPRAAVVFALLAGCASTLSTKLPSSASFSSSATDGGWTRVAEAGWFAVDFPQPPHTQLVPDRGPRGTFTFKKLSLQTSDALYVVNYVEFANEADAEDVLRALHDRSATTTAKGARLRSTHDADVAGARGFDVVLDLDADSELNGSNAPAVAHSRTLLAKRRLYFLQFSAPTAKPTDDENRFFASFTLESPS